ncbi:poly(U)-specific endoribonuclease homolog isoform X1 [Nylanderia fulva]|uniref:poly(U)-specific endoribonuclease homolog isoform X1 n=1 Tax=Nylanderia fulva TaxID=613905 RepID=UPI0010FB5C89|nr:poly(U)-specific endoribonuclease homolog isoform X1 [Nylanderia fulva]
MEIRILLFIFLFTLLIKNDVNAGKFGSSRISSSRGGSYSSSRGSSSHSSSRHVPTSFGSSSSSTRYGTPSSSSTRYGSPSSSSTRYGSSSSGQTTGTSSTGTLSSHTSHQQNKDMSASILHSERGAGRPSQTNSAQPSSQSSTPYGHAGTYPGSQVGKPSVPENKQNSAPYPSAPHFAPHNPSAPYNPSAPSADHLSKVTVPSQSHAPTSFGQPNTPYNPSHTVNNNPSWSNPHFNPNQPPPYPTSTNIGFKEHLRPTAMPVPSYPVQPPRTSYPVSGSNPYPPPYSNQAFGHSMNQPHSTYNPSQTFGHSSNYPAHIPPPVPGTFGNPYSTHPVGGTYSPAGHSYPQQHVLAQPAAQPYIPGQTIIMAGQQDSGRGFGQMVKEALVFSTINAGVNRLINPHHHYASDYGRPVSSTSETHETHNNYYFNTAPNNAPSIPALPNVSQGQGNVPLTYPVNYPSSVNNPAITPGVSSPITVGNNSSVTYPVSNDASMNAVRMTNNMGGPPVAPSAEISTGNTVNNKNSPDEGTIVYSPQHMISDNELMMLTEELFAKQEVNISKYLTIHVQSKSENITDEAKGPLLYTQQEVYDYPTIQVIRALYDNYEHNSTVKENRTLEKRKKEDLLLDVFLNTNVMTRAMQWLSDRGFIDPDDFEKKDILRHIWFTQFDGATSGFERVFTSERYGADLLGVQDWIYFDYQESKRRIDYLGYVDTLKLGDRASLLKLNFKMDDVIRPNATIFVGTLPELEMSLYTICFYARTNNLCPVSLGGAKFNIFTHSFRYYGKDLIDLALPIF